MVSPLAGLAMLADVRILKHPITMKMRSTKTIRACILDAQMQRLVTTTLQRLQMTLRAAMQMKGTIAMATAWLIRTATAYAISSK